MLCNGRKGCVTRKQKLTDKLLINLLKSPEHVTLGASGLEWFTNLQTWNWTWIGTF
jgi:hypothetical protein